MPLLYQMLSAAAAIAGAPVGGDLAGTLPNPTVVGITGTAGVTAIHGATLRWDLGVASPTLHQADQTAASTNGQNLTVQAQNATGVTSSGGNLRLSSGTGTTAAGNVDLQTGGVSQVLVNPSGTVTLRSAGTNTITTAGTEAILEQTGDASGTTRIRVQSRSGVNGLLIDNPTLDLADLVLKGSAHQFVMRMESRAGSAVLSASALPEFQFGVAGTPTFVANSQAVGLGFLTPLVQWTPSVVSPKLFQIDIGTASATGQTLTVHAQNATGATSFGGNLDLTSGTGTTGPGAVNLQTGGTSRFTVTDTKLSMAAPTLAFTPTQASATIRQDDEISVNGRTLLVQAQNSTAGGSTGGALDLRSGTGISLPGAVTIRAGATTRIQVNTTGLGFFGVTPVARSAAYTVTNPTTDRALNVTADTLAQGLAVLGTLILDLQLLGLVG